jgi:glycosyltransferase involved in cell wall biosynthesis
MYKFSILTPVLNGEKYISQCIESVINQEYTDYEHIISDGGSSDATMDIIYSYIERYPERIKVIQKKDKGVGDALRNAYEHSTGNIIGWLDTDDIYYSSALKNALTYFKNGSKFVYGECDIINDRSQKIGKFFIDQFNESSWVNNWHYIVFAAMFVEKSVIQKVGFVNDLGNDLDFYLRVAKKFQLTTANEKFSAYRLHSNSISLKPSKREVNVRYNRAKEDFFITLLNPKGSIFSPRGMTFIALCEPRIIKFLSFLRLDQSRIIKKLAYCYRYCIAHPSDTGAYKRKLISKFFK